MGPSPAKEAEYNKRCGEILRTVVGIETQFDHIIFNYFCFTHDEKRHFFRDAIMNRTDFNRKIEMLQKICAIEKVELSEEVLKDITFLKDIRNTVAHYEGSQFGLNKFVLSRYKIARDGTLTEHSIELTNKLMRQVGKKYESVSNKLLGIHNELNKILLKQETDFIKDCIESGKRGRIVIRK